MTVDAKLWSRVATVDLALLKRMCRTAMTVDAKPRSNVAAVGTRGRARGAAPLRVGLPGMQ